MSGQSHSPMPKPTLDFEALMVMLVQRLDILIDQNAELIGLLVEGSAEDEEMVTERYMDGTPVRSS